ncbi:MAG TPA: UV DNA damage repair endonuclease UvsE [Gemmatimonadales bacterium]|nr:UV DNA damage repair endonuclease UvsE [Gemmatimonadales bacterium]
MIRWGLCCQFLDAPIRFRSATHRYVSTLTPKARREYLGAIARDNAAALMAAVHHCRALGIGAFRINSQVLPLGTHPVSGYGLDRIDRTGEARRTFLEAAALAKQLDVRLSFHPDQFVVLNSEREAVVESSLREVEFQAEIAELVGADVIVLHGGGAAGGKEAALARLTRAVERLSGRVRGRLAIENDDRMFAPADLLPVCARLGIPLVYDVHHHRCNGDGLSEREATTRAVATWGHREPYFHISSPRAGWQGDAPRPHADYIDPSDLPQGWMRIDVTVDVEAKAKERAVLALMAQLSEMAAPIRRASRPISRSMPAGDTRNPQK